MPIEVRAYQCQYKCRQPIVTSRKSMESHEQRCFHNPARKSCQTCRFTGFEPSDMSVGIQGGFFCDHSDEDIADERTDVISREGRRLSDCIHWEITK